MRVVIAGAGIAGLTTALALARDGHAVTVVERDLTAMPATADDAFSAWARRGAPQVRHSHAFLARLRNLLQDRAPDVLEHLLAAGATEIRFTDHLPETLTDHAPRPGDDELVALACRRTTFEWVLRERALSRPGVALRDGVDVVGLDVTGGTRPRVVGARVRDARATRPGERRPSRPISSSMRAGRAAVPSGGWSPRGSTSRRPRCTRPASCTCRASTGCTPGAEMPVGEGPDRRRSRSPQVRGVPRRQPHVLGDAGRRLRRHRAAPPARPAERLRGRGRDVGAGTGVARRAGRTDHRRPSHGRPAQSQAAVRRARSADRRRIRRGRRRLGLHEPALRPGLLARGRSRLRSRRRAARARRRRSLRVARVRRVHRRRARSVVPCRGAAGRGVEGVRGRCRCAAGRRRRPTRLHAFADARRACSRAADVAGRVPCVPALVQPARAARRADRRRRGDLRGDGGLRRRDSRPPPPTFGPTRDELLAILELQ